MAQERLDLSLMSASNLFITGGNYMQLNTSNFLSMRTIEIETVTRDDPEAAGSIDIIKDAVAPSAFHNSAERLNTSRCHRNTRTAVLRKIMDWILGQDYRTRDKVIMWLTGAAGAGKSAIAQSIIDLSIRNGHILASFFFNRFDWTRNNPKSLIATLLYQIYFVLPAIQPSIILAINGDPLIFTRNLHHQFDTLINQPLRRLFHTHVTGNVYGRHLIVIDGLDECVDQGAQMQIMNMLRNTAQTHDSPIIFLVTSRADHTITTAFNSHTMKCLWARLCLDDDFKSYNDIRTYLCDSFDEIKKDHPFIKYATKPWPSPSVIDKLVEKSSGQFIYAATVIRYICSIDHRPDHRLDIVMDLRSSLEDRPFAQLDSLYAMILASLKRPDLVLDTLGLYLTVLETDDELTALQIEHILAFCEGEMDILFCNLRALISIQDSISGERRREIKFLHASFQDFLLDERRSKEFFINKAVHRSKLVSGLLRYLPKAGIHDAWNLVCLFGEYSRKCEITHELTQQISIFPLQNFLQDTMRAVLKDKHSIGWKGVQEEFLVPFLDLLKRVDNSLIVLEQHQKGLDAFYVSELRHYYEDDALASIVSMACCTGTDHLVPQVKEVRYYSFGWRFEEPQYRTHIAAARSDEDTLRLAKGYALGDYVDKFRQNITQFLRNSARCGEHSAWSETYAKAAMHCIGDIEDLKHAWSDCSTFNEEIFFSEITFTDGIWTWNVSRGEWVGTERRLFLLLRYLSYFLPRAARYAPLIRRCREEIISSGPLTEHYPLRANLAIVSIRTYLERNDTTNAVLS